MKKIILSSLLLTASFTLAQELDPPPPATPTVENKIFIDELIKVTNFEKYFYNYCKNKIEQTAKENNWDEKKKQEIIKSIHFEQFNNTIYNTFALYSKEELMNITGLFKSLNNKSYPQLVPMSYVIQHNLEGFVIDLAQGDYLFLNK
ncbi:hypothetical protein IQ37_04470 [Chryseobacterium piperi]|uniref:Uncharacterized protein n=1 Tax=Chryseobacterium piperi TaxID=558152 RepID=A0A086BL59_9FLAO|nr:hypothetical protein [Chryseobacterium piperi]ASW74631.1 hypothetical protein CJF12_10280 [Chryseobacterium piperi]KFF29673.1 hypothetical protein IQ37_04470 [Chryseobacterium piperi]